MYVFVNPQDNTDYVIYDTAFAPITLGVNSWGDLESDQSVYEEHQPIIYKPIPQPFFVKKKTTQTLDSSSSSSSSSSKPPFKPALKRKAVSDTLACSSRSSSNYKKEKRGGGEEETCITKTEFVHHFTSLLEAPDPKLITKVYMVLDGFKITPQVMDVVTDLVQFVNAKSLENTMAYKKRSKTFKAQLSYLLVGITQLK